MVDKMKDNLAELLTNIFATSGHSVSESDTVDLIIEKNNTKTYIKLAIEPDISEIRAFADVVEDNIGLYVSLEKMNADIWDYATHIGLITWDRDELAFQIGKAVIADIEGNTSDLELVAYDVEPSQTEELPTQTLDAISSDTDTEIWNSNNIQPDTSTANKPGFNIWRTSPEMQKAETTNDLMPEETAERTAPAPTIMQEPQTTSWQQQNQPFTLDLHTAPIKLLKDRSTLR